MGCNGLVRRWATSWAQTREPSGLVPGRTPQAEAKNQYYRRWKHPPGVDLSYLQYDERRGYHGRNDPVVADDEVVPEPAKPDEEVEYLHAATGSACRRRRRSAA